MRTATYRYDDETVVVTGGSSGIGREIALRFADAGAAVVNADVTDRPKDDEAEVPTHELIRDSGGTATFVRTDVSEPADVKAAVDAAREHGGVDVMVNNAGIHTTGSVREVTPAEFDEIHGINVRGCFFGCQAAANDMIERDEGGVIVNLASISSRLAKPEQIVYESTKGAILMITRSAALELAEHDVRVNAVAPGRTSTEFGATSADAKARSVEEGDLLKPIPAGRAGTPADCAEAVLFLASDNAEYVVGETLFVDGGYQVV